MAIFHITDRAAWTHAQALGSYRGCALETEGFIHCSNVEQVARVANTKFVARDDLVVLEVDTERVTAEVRWENLEGGTELFPHIYGAIETSWVRRVYPLERDKDEYSFPPREPA